MEAIPEPTEKKCRKRPWRNRVRMLAKKDTQKKHLVELTEKAVDDGSEEKAELDSYKASIKRIKKKKVKEVEEKEEVEEGPEHNLEDINALEDKLVGSRFRFINEKLYTIRGYDAFEMFQKDPEPFEAYHQGYRFQVKKWPINPVDRVITILRQMKKGTVIADMGCGDAKIAKELGKQHTVHSFDLLSVKEGVIACDMANVPLENETVDVVVYCLSLMGTNLSSFLCEAHRILKTGGELIIAEVVSRFKNVRLFCIALEKLGFKIETKKVLNNFFSLITCKKEGDIKAKRPLGLRLDPCLYKKR
uniref:Ribosomal RNA-processing protein 8 n=1 Tax=Rhabditophanes sp. KR3021 TaxID=114890 RepID=A0AC35U353_9BILA